MATRWNNNPRQGSAFHELVVLPTLAPQLARPFFVPGTPEHHAAEAARRQQAAANPGSFPNYPFHISFDDHHKSCAR